MDDHPNVNWQWGWVIIHNCSRSARFQSSMFLWLSDSQSLPLSFIHFHCRYNLIHEREWIGKARKWRNDHQSLSIHSSVVNERFMIDEWWWVMASSSNSCHVENLELDEWHQQSFIPSLAHPSIHEWMTGWARNEWMEWEWMNESWRLTTTNSFIHEPFTLGSFVKLPLRSRLHSLARVQQIINTLMSGWLHGQSARELTVSHPPIHTFIHSWVQQPLQSCVNDRCWVIGIAFTINSRKYWHAIPRSIPFISLPFRSPSWEWPKGSGNER